MYIFILFVLILNKIIEEIFILIFFTFPFFFCLSLLLVYNRIKLAIKIRKVIKFALIYYNLLMDKDMGNVSQQEKIKIRKERQCYVYKIKKTLVIIQALAKR